MPDVISDNEEEIYEVEINELDDDNGYNDDDYDEENDEDGTVSNDEEANYHTSSNAIVSFNKHRGSVFCGDLDKDNLLAVTGGEDDKAYVWSTNTGEIEFECVGHKDSVTCVAFSYDGKYVATGDMSGLVQVWLVKEQNLIGTVEESELEWLKWHHKTNAIFCGFGNGLISIWDIEKNVRKILSDGNEDPCVDGVILKEGKSVLSGYKSGRLQLWNINTATTTWVNSHMETIFNIHVNQTDTLAICSPGGELVDITTGKIMKKLQSGEDPIETALFFNEPALPKTRFIVTGTLSGDLHVWEHQHDTFIRYSQNFNNSITTIVQICDEKVGVACNSGLINIYNIRTGIHEFTLYDHNKAILSLKKFHSAQLFLATSDDGTATILTIVNSIS